MLSKDTVRSPSGRALCDVAPECCLTKGYYSWCSFSHRCFRSHTPQKALPETVTFLPLGSHSRMLRSNYGHTPSIRICSVLVDSVRTWSLLETPQQTLRCDLCEPVGNDFGLSRGFTTTGWRPFRFPLCLHTSETCALQFRVIAPSWVTVHLLRTTSAAPASLC